MEDDGFVVARGVLDARLCYRLRSLAERKLEEQRARFKADTGVAFEDESGITDYLKRVQADDLPPELLDLVRGQLPLPNRLDEEWLAITRSAALTDLVRDLVGSESLRMHYPPMIRFKFPGQNQADVPMHQDFQYFLNVFPFITTWIPLTSITEQCGGVNILAGSHKLGRIEHSSLALWSAGIDSDYSKRYPPRHVLMAPGDVLAFHPYTLHCSQPNVSTGARYNLDCRWFSAQTASRKQYFDLQQRSVVKVY